MAKLLKIAISLLLVGAAHAHDHWINHGHYMDPVTGVDCCNENDCKPLGRTAIEGVINMPDGGMIVQGQQFSRGQLHKSEDGLWYRCANRCVFRPVQG